LSNRLDRCPQRPYYRFYYGSRMTTATTVRTLLTVEGGRLVVTDHVTADLRGQRSVVVSLCQASPTSHGMETA
jgi:hypothetical protein